MVRTRAELLHFKNQLLMRTFKASTVTEVIKMIEFEENRYNKLVRMLPSNIPATDLALSPSDMTMILVRSLPNWVREYIVMHSPSDDFDQMRRAALLYETNQRTWSELAGSSQATYMHGMFEKEKGKSKGKGKEGKGKGKGKSKSKDKGKSESEKSAKSSETSEKEKNAVCFRCNRTGRFAANCHAKKDKDGKPIESKPGGKGDGSKKGSKGSKGKGSGKGKKIHGLVGEEQPEGEESPAQTQSDAAKAAAPLNPFVASLSPSSTWFEDTVQSFEEGLEDDVVEIQYADNVSSPSRLNQFFKETSFACQSECLCFKNDLVEKPVVIADNFQRCLDAVFKDEPDFASAFSSSDVESTIFYPWFLWLACQ